MTQIEQIKAKIERLKSCKLNFEEDTEYLRGYDFAIDTIKEFINSIPSEQANDVEEEINDYFERHIEICNDNTLKCGGEEFDAYDLINVIEHFIQWQKEQMMKDAVNGIMDCDDDNEWIEITDKLIVTPSRAGKKVKIYIIMEDEK